MLTIKKMILCIALNLVLATFSVFAAPRLIVPPEGVAFGEISARIAPQAGSIVYMRTIWFVL